MPVPPELLALLVCPTCHGELEYREPESRLLCASCKVSYPVRGDIPILLLDEATPL